MNCKGKTHGHNYIGGVCLDCGGRQINDDILSKPIIKLKEKSSKGIHSNIHYLAREISEHYKEPKKFGMYLGVIKRVGTEKAFRVWAECKQSKKDNVKLFFYKIKTCG